MKTVQSIFLVLLMAMACAFNAMNGTPDKIPAASQVVLIMIFGIPFIVTGWANL